MSLPDYESMMDSYPETAIVFGASAMTELEAELLLNDAKSVLFFLGASSADRSGAWQAALKATASGETEVIRHDGIPPEPDVACVENMIASIEKNKPDIVAAIGGGSVMDATKAAYAAWQAKLPVQELFGAGQLAAKRPGQSFKQVVCIPTTAGTGSEVTPYANIVDRERGVKMLIADPQIIPSFAFVEPDFTRSAPQGLTRQVAFDALTHSVEGFLNLNAKNAHKDADEWALASMSLIVDALPTALRDPSNYVARERLSAAATLGGMVIKNKPTSLPHLCSFSFFDLVPHGIVVSSLLAEFWKLYLESPAVRERTMLLKGVFPGVDQNSPEEIVEAFHEFLVSNGGPKSLGALPGCDAALAKKAAKAAKENPVKLASCPRPVSVEESEKLIGAILKKAFEA